MYLFTYRPRQGYIFCIGADPVQAATGEMHRAVACRDVGTPAPAYLEDETRSGCSHPDVPGNQLSLALGKERANGEP